MYENGHSDRLLAPSSGGTQDEEQRCPVLICSLPPICQVVLAVSFFFGSKWWGWLRRFLKALRYWASVPRPTARPGFALSWSQAHALVDHCLSAWACAASRWFPHPTHCSWAHPKPDSHSQCLWPPEVAPNQGPARSVEVEFLGCSSLWAGVQRRENMAQDLGCPASVKPRKSFGDRGHLVNVSGCKVWFGVRLRV